MKWISKITSIVALLAVFSWISFSFLFADSTSQASLIAKFRSNPEFLSVERSFPYLDYQKRFSVNWKGIILDIIPNTKLPESIFTTVSSQWSPGAIAFENNQIYKIELRRSSDLILDLRLVDLNGYTQLEDQLTMDQLAMLIPEKLRSSAPLIETNSSIQHNSGAIRIK